MSGLKMSAYAIVQKTKNMTVIKAYFYW